MDSPVHNPPDPAEPDQLIRLLSEEGMQERFSSIYPSRDSLRWAIRKHRSALAKAGALYVINGRNRFDPDRFAKTIADAGRQAALASASFG